MANGGCESCHGPRPGACEDDDKRHIRRLATPRSTPAPATRPACRATPRDRTPCGMAARTTPAISPARPATACMRRSRSRGQLKADTQTALCQTCHQQQVAKLRRASHMPVTEGKMECSSCHNPHGTAQRQAAQGGELAERACISCHTEKRAGRSCTSTRRSATTARPATTRTGRHTTACWSSGHRCSANAATSTRGTLRRCTTNAAEQPQQPDVRAGASTATRPFTAPITRPASRCFARRTRP